jgi:hypothetical protein
MAVSPRASVSYFARQLAPGRAELSLGSNSRARSTAMLKSPTV